MKIKKEINTRYIIVVTYLLVGNIYEFLTTLLVVMNCQNVDKLVTPIGKEKEYQVILFLYPGNYLGVNGLALAVVLALALQAIFLCLSIEYLKERNCPLSS